MSKLSTYQLLYWYYVIQFQFSFFMLSKMYKMVTNWQPFFFTSTYWFHNFYCCFLGINGSNHCQSNVYVFIPILTFLLWKKYTIFIPQFNSIYRHPRLLLVLCFFRKFVPPMNTFFINICNLSMVKYYHFTIISRSKHRM